MPFSPDPQEGRALLSGGVGSYPRENLHSYHPRRGNGALFADWERILSSCGLGSNIEGGNQTQHLVIPRNSTPPLKRVTGYDMRTSHPIPISIHEREIPEELLNDAKVRELILHLHPGLKSEERKIRRRARHRASFSLSIIFLWFRCLLHASEIAAELDVSENRVMQAAMDIRTHGFFEGTCRCGNRYDRWRENAKAAS